METLIIHSPTLFDDQSNLASHASSPPLPPAPLGEPQPPFAYGSAHTKFSEHGSQQQVNTPLPQTLIPQTSTSDDFSPQLPHRPPASIHPSSRGGSGTSNGLSNTSPTRSEAEINLTNQTASTQAPPRLLRPGRQGALTPIQSLRGTKGLDFSEHEIPDGDWTGPAPGSPPLSNPPTPHPPPPSALSQSTFAQQQQPALAQILTKEQPQPKDTALPQHPPPSPTVEKTAVGDFESIASPLEIRATASSTEDDGHSTDYASPITPDAPTGPTLQPVTSQSLTQREPHVLLQLPGQPQVPIQVAQVQEQSQPAPVQSVRQSGEIPHSERKPQDPLSPLSQ